MNKIKTPMSKVIEIMNIVVKKIESKKSNSNRQSLVFKLLEKGYSPDDIDTALSLVSMMTSKVNPLLTTGERDTDKNGSYTGVRHLHSIETLRLTNEAHELLLKLVEDGIITEHHLEKTLEYITAKDIRNVSSTRLEVLLMINRPISDIEEEQEHQYTPVSIELH